MLRPAISISLAGLAAALLTPAPSASGEPPTPVDPTPETFAAGEACQFPISASATGKLGFIELSSSPQYSAISPSPGLRVTVTNLNEPAKSLRINATGAFRFVDRPDGSVEIRAAGHNFLYGEPDVGATALATTGPIVLVISPDGDLVDVDVSRARVRDLCAELA